MMGKVWMVLCGSLAVGCAKESEGTKVDPSPVAVVDAASVKFFEGSYEDHWEKFKTAMVSNDTEWDWLKFVENPQMKGKEHSYGDVFKDDFTLELLKDTSYDSLELVEKDGQKYREFSVVAVDAEGTPQGTVYIFHEGSYGLMLVGERPFSSK